MGKILKSKITPIKSKLGLTFLKLFIPTMTVALHITDMHMDMFMDTDIMVLVLSTTVTV